MFAHRQFAALGTYAYLASSADADRAERIAREVLADVDRTCSRFRADSDLNRANANAGRWTEVDPLLAAAVSVAVGAAEETGGLVDPCLGIRIAEIGYDADFGLLGRHRAGHPAMSPATHPASASAPHPIDRWRELEFDPAGAVRVPAGVRLDLGATAKAWASDLVALSILEETGEPAVVSLGGDLRIAAAEGSGFGGWPVSITENPPEIAGAPRGPGAGAEEQAEVVHLSGGGLATSSSQVRRWTSDGVERHHLIDPRTGEPASGTWRTATVTGPTCVAANIAATAAIVLGEAAVPWLSERGVDARLVDRDGLVHRVGSWPAAGSETTTEGEQAR